MGVEDSDIKEGGLFAFIPKILGLDVESCAISVLVFLRGKLSPVSGWSGFYTHVRANLCGKLRRDVSDSIVSDGGHGTLRAAEGVVNAEWLTAWAVCG